MEIELKLRHLPRGVGEDVGDDLHRRGRRVDVGVADHELLEDVVLDGPGQLLVRDALLLGRDDVQREDGQHGTVHGHRHRHAVERDAVEQLPHVVDRVDGHPGHADVAGHPRVVGVVAAVGGQVERDRQALLPGGEVAAVERVRLLRGGEPRVLADRPRLRRVHRRVRPAQERRDPRIRPEEVEPRGVVGGVERPDPRCPPGESQVGGASAPSSAAFQRPAGRRACPSRGTAVKSGIVTAVTGDLLPVEYRVRSRRSTARASPPAYRCPSSPSTRAFPARSTCRAPASRRAATTGAARSA